VGTHLGPALFVLNSQLIFRDWFLDQIRTGQSVFIPVPDFGYYLKAFERQNNLNWLPLVSNVPALLALRAAPAHVANAYHPDAIHVTAQTSIVTRATPDTKTRNLGPRVRKPGCDAHFTGNTAFANKVGARRVEDVI
jgi:hypothetical protein